VTASLTGVAALGADELAACSGPVEANALAVAAALGDAGVERSAVDAVLTYDSIVAPDLMQANRVAEYLGLAPSYAATVGSGGATPAAAVAIAIGLIEAGLARNVVFAHADLRAAVKREAVGRMAAVVGNPEFEAPFGPIVPTLYSFLAQWLIESGRATREDLARIAVQTRAWAALNPAAKMRKPLTLEEVLDAPRVAGPLGRYDCCLITDFAGALVVSGEPDVGPLAGGQQAQRGGSCMVGDRAAGGGDAGADRAADRGRAGEDRAARGSHASADRVAGEGCVGGGRAAEGSYADADRAAGGGHATADRAAGRGRAGGDRVAGEGRGDAGEARQSRAVRILGAAGAATHEEILQMDADDPLAAPTALAGELYGQAGVTASDLDLAYLYDSFTVTTGLQLLAYGIDGGEGLGALLADPGIGPGGRLPVNTHGGLLSATTSGLFHIVEAVRQLRGEAGDRQVDGARTALVSNIGGVFSNHCALLLAR
jgi:hypothetical protein